MVSFVVWWYMWVGPWNKQNVVRGEVDVCVEQCM
jgi:hypothetical protein